MQVELQVERQGTWQTLHVQEMFGRLEMVSVCWTAAKAACKTCVSAEGSRRLDAHLAGFCNGLAPFACHQCPMFPLSCLFDTIFLILKYLKIIVLSFPIDPRVPYPGRTTSWISHFSKPSSRAWRMIRPQTSEALTCYLRSAARHSKTVSSVLHIVPHWRFTRSVTFLGNMKLLQ